MSLTRQQIAEKIAEEIKDGFVVNLGIGIPTLVANCLEGKDVLLQSENGILGMGAFPLEKDVDPDLINAGKQTVSVVKGASFFSSADSFAMIRGGHVDLTVLGAMEVDAEGSLANWMIPGKVVKGMGGAMDLVSGAKRVVVAMQHCNRKGESKLLAECTLPLTGYRCVDRVVTDLGVFDIRQGSFVLVDKPEDVTVEEIQEKTKGPLIVEE